MSRTLRILMNISQYDYGRRELGYSFEYDTFYNYFEKKDYQVVLFDYLICFNKGGKELVDKKLRQILKQQHFDLIFTFPMADHFLISTLEVIKKQHTGAISLAWMADDKWRWENYSQFFAPHFDFVVTTDPGAIAKYQSINYQHALLSQWAHDPSIFRKFKKIDQHFDVVFIGGSSAWRQYIIKRLQQKGINVHCYGTGWPNGRLSVKEIVQKYNQACIVLNLSNSAQAYLPFLFWTQSPKWCGSIKASITHSLPGLVEFITTPKRREDIKARFFEVTGCGAFLLSYPVEHLDSYLRANKDLVTYTSLNDLVKKINYFLCHEDDREKIAKCGYQATLSNHTYDQRFKQIFTEIGLI